MPPSRPRSTRSWPARRLVGVMGGHAAQRGEAGYAAGGAARSSLARAGVLVGTGGGPGAMEAVHLGAHLAAHDDDALDAALGRLAAVPSFRPSIEGWVRSGLRRAAEWPARDGPLAAIGVPTWFYGHEPPNVFAGGRSPSTSRRRARGDAAAALCRGASSSSPAAGTVQEIFQDACENYYADEAMIAPMVLVDVAHWTTAVAGLAAAASALGPRAGDGRPRRFVDTVEEAAQLRGTAGEHPGPPRPPVEPWCL